jgi:hypothetical protein
MMPILSCGLILALNYDILIQGWNYKSQILILCLTSIYLVGVSISYNHFIIDIFGNTIGSFILNHMYQDMDKIITSVFEFSKNTHEKYNLVPDIIYNEQMNELKQNLLKHISLEHFDYCKENQLSIKNYPYIFIQVKNNESNNDTFYKIIRKKQFIGHLSWLILSAIATIVVSNLFIHTIESSHVEIKSGVI